MLHQKTALVLLLCLVLPSCSFLGLNDDQRDRLEKHRHLWQEQGTSNYQFDLRKGCFCPYLNELYPATMVVHANTISAVLDPKTGDTLQAPRSEGTALEEFPHSYVTVEELFEVVERAIDEDYARLEVEYNEEVGYPERIDFEIGDATDDEVTYNASNLTLQ